MIKIYTDGSYKPSTDQGGYSAVIVNNDQIVEILYEGFKYSSNNRQELYGVLKGLEFFKTPKHIIIYSDSNYIVNSINNGYVEQWIKNKDNTKKNLDLWSRIYELTKFHNVKFNWVKAHNNDKYNELADLYANIASIVLNPNIDISDKNL